MKIYYIVLFIVGLTSLFSSFLPILIRKWKISFTIPLLLTGMVLYYLGAPLPWPDPVWPVTFALRFSELVVIISLMVAGLKIGLNYSWKEWRNPIRLLSITMPLFMLAVFLISYYILDFEGPVSLLLAAVLAPTDPALASEIQLRNKQSKKSKNLGVQYNLTAEAGLNDGLAFPFVYLAILWSQDGNLSNDNWIEWFGFYLIYKVVVGVLIGIIIGYLYSFLTKRLSNNNERRIHQAFVAISLTFISYGLTEIAEGYGFLSVFFAGLFAHFHKHKNEQESSPSDPSIGFIEDIEKFLIIFWMIFFGGSIIAGILNFITWPTVVFSFALILLVRPVIGYFSLHKSGLKKNKKMAIAFFGIRGIGSVYYLTYAIKNGDFPDINEFYSILSLIILISILIHGFTVKRFFSAIEKSEEDES